MKVVPSLAFLFVLALSFAAAVDVDEERTIAGVAQSWGKALLNKMADPLRRQRDGLQSKGPKKWEGAPRAKKGGMRESLRKWMGRDKEVRASRGKQAIKGVVHKRGPGGKKQEGSQGLGQGAHAHWGQQFKPKPKPQPQPTDDAADDDVKPKPKPKPKAGPKVRAHLPPPLFSPK